MDGIGRSDDNEPAGLDKLVELESQGLCAGAATVVGTGSKIEDEEEGRECGV